MKKSILAAAVAATGAGMLMSSGALAWDSWDLDGGASQEYHITTAVVQQPGAGYAALGQPGGASVTVKCAPLEPCDTIYGSGGLQAQSFIIINNKTIGSPGTGVVDTQDTYTFLSSDYDASGNPDTASPNFGDYQSIWRPQSHGYLPTIFPPVIAQGVTQQIPQSVLDPQGVYPDVFEITTNAEGKITGGWYAFTAVNQAGEPRLIITDWDQSPIQAIGFASGTIGDDFSGLPTIAEVKSILADINAGNPPTAGYGAVYGPNADWKIQGVLDVSYETCDITFECGQFGKSVPVPAFAAASLGLGLLGITYLTGRRRAIK